MTERAQTLVIEGEGGIATSVSLYARVTLGTDWDTEVPSLLFTFSVESDGSTSSVMVSPVSVLTEIFMVGGVLVISNSTNAGSSSNTNSGCSTPFVNEL
jgi:hypothetical protein